ncbi:hypothetical protein NDU88_000322 [Pleurodeles waltl]|uniref:Uncharacterized protein n=1 Tax=Pleurodeles waltl TaxID=8319 RepID=A0AAV7TFY6_PLEWA|nr:hypothetical protein NDU88_000322 [Pleurodeles waltl]
MLLGHAVEPGVERDANHHSYMRQRRSLSIAEHPEALQEGHSCSATQEALYWARVERDSNPTSTGNRGGHFRQPSTWRRYKRDALALWTRCAEPGMERDSNAHHCLRQRKQSAKHPEALQD